MLDYRPNRPLGLDKAARLVTIVAPGGYGKTTAIARWIAEQTDQDRRIVYLELDPRMTAPTMLAQLGARLADHGVIAAARSPTTDAAALLEALAGAAEAHIVIDHAESAADNALGRCLGDLIAGAPEQCRWVVAGRRRLGFEEAGFDVARLVGLGAVQEIGPADLALTADEEAQAWRDAGFEPPVLDVDGWPAPLALALNAAASAAPALRRTCAEHAVARYVGRTVLSALTPDERGFLADLSLSPTIDPALARAATGSPDAPRRLNNLVETHALAVLAVGRQGQAAWRLPAPLRACLRQDLDVQHPAHVAQLHGALADHFEALGDKLQAVEHALAAGDDDRAARIVERPGLFCSLSDGGAVRRLALAALPEPLFDAYPRLRLLRVWNLLSAGHSEEASLLLQDIRATTQNFWVDRPGGEPGLLRIEAKQLEWCIPFWNGLPVPEDFAVTLEDSITDGPRFDPQAVRSTRQLVTAVLVSAGRHVRAEQEVRRFERIGNDPQFPELPFWPSFYRASILTERLQFDEARAQCDLAVKYVATDAVRRPLLLDAVTLLRGDIAYERGELFGLVPRLDAAASRLESEGGWYEMVGSAFMLAAAAAYADGGAAAAVPILDRASQLGLRRQWVVLGRLCELRRRRIDLRSGRRPDERTRLAIEAFAEQTPGGRQTNGLTWREYAEGILASAEFAIAEGRPDSALPLLGAASDQARADQLWRSLSRFEAAAAIALDARGDAAGSGRMLLAVLDRLVEGRIFRPLVDAGPPLLALLGKAEAEPQRYGVGPRGREMLRLLSRVARASTERPSGRGWLTDREVAILERLADGDTSKAIARALNLSESTVKFHLKRVFAKLAVRTRYDAVAEARRRGLIDG